MDGVSAAAAVDALAGTAATLTLKGYRYIKAVRNSEKEVAELVGELTSLESLLGHVRDLLEEKEVEEGANGTRLRVPQFVYQFEQTFNKISDILSKFDSAYAATRKDAHQDGSADAVTKDKGLVTKIKDLNISSKIPSRFKWPLAQTETMALVTTLQRHKETCQLALTTQEWEGVRELLGLQKKAIEVGSKVRDDVAAVRAAMESELEKKETQTILGWLSKHDPSEKHDACRQVHEDGTGEWVFDLPQYKLWRASQNTGLWIYGIPGAGKTVLSSLIIHRLIDEDYLGVAYYYCQYQHAASQEPVNVLSWWIKALAEQDMASLDVVKSFYKEHNPPHKPAKRPTLSELEALLHRIASNFTQVTLLLDGLDECGASQGIDRSELLPIVARLLSTKKRNIKVLVASRPLEDIKRQLQAFENFKLAAESADLRLYIKAEMHRRATKLSRNSDFKEKVMKVLIEKSEGMFMYCKCQIDYLCTLPTDRDRELALKELPPDLHSTYIRILEIIDRDLSSRTTKLVKRALKWVAYHQDGIGDEQSNMNLTSLTHAISFDHSEPPRELDESMMAEEDDVLEWLGSLVRMNRRVRMLEFSHFTVKEFLECDPDDAEKPVKSLVARSYLLHPTRDCQYLAQSCLAYLSSPVFDLAALTKQGYTRAEFRHRYPFYEHAACMFPNYVQAAASTMNDSVALEGFFTAATTGPFASWMSFHNSMSEGTFLDVDSPWILASKSTWRPLQVASALLLEPVVNRLLSQGASVNEADEYSNSPLHLAINGPIGSTEMFLNEFQCEPRLKRYQDPEEAEFWGQFSLKRAAVVESLLEAGADVNDVGKTRYHIGEMGLKCFTPLAQAVFFLDVEIAQLLIAMGAKCCVEESDPDDIAEFVRIFEMTISIDMGFNAEAVERSATFLKMLPEVADFVGGARIKHLLLPLEGNGSLEDNSPVSSNFLNIAATFGRVDLLEWAIARHADLESQWKGHLPMCVAVSSGHASFVAKLEEHGASRHSLCEGGDSPLISAYYKGGHEYAETLFAQSEDVGLSEDHKIDVLRAACSSENHDIMNYLVELGVGIATGQFLEYREHPPPKVATLTVAQEHGLLSTDYGRKVWRDALRKGQSDLVKYLVSVEFRDDIIDTYDLPDLTVQNYNAFFILAQTVKLPREVREKLIDTSLLIGCNDLRLLLLSQTIGSEWRDSLGNTLLHVACSTKDINLIASVLDSGLSTEIRNFSGETPVHPAVQTWSKEIVELFAAYEADFTTQDLKDNTVLHKLTQDVHPWLAGGGVSDIEAATLCSRLIQLGADPNKQDDLKVTPLHRAAERDCPKTAAVLLDALAEVDIVDAQGWCPVHVAAVFGSEWVLKLLIQPGRVPNSLELPSQDGRVALHFAAAHGRSKLCEILIEAKADVNTSNHQGLTPSHEAARAGRDESLQILLKAGADINKLSKSGQSPLLFASAAGHLSTVSLLLAFGADLATTDHNGVSAIHCAVTNGHELVVSALLKAGSPINLNARTNDGSTILHVAIRNKSLGILRALLQEGANVNLPDNSGMTPLDLVDLVDFEMAIPILLQANARHGDEIGSKKAHILACSAVRLDRPQSLQRLLDRGLEVDLAGDQFGNTPLLLAAAMGKVEMFKTLQQYGCDISARNYPGESVLMLAAKSRTLNLCIDLLTAGVDVLTEDLTGQTALHTACRSGDRALVQLLIKQETFKATAFSQYAEPTGTPLIAAISHGNPTIVHDLVEAGAPVDGKQVRFGTPLIAACMKGNAEIVKMLLSKGAVQDPEGSFWSASEAAARFGHRHLLSFLD